MKVDLDVVGPLAVATLFGVMFIAWMSYATGYSSGHKDATYEQRIRCMEEQGKGY